MCFIFFEFIANIRLEVGRPESEVVYSALNTWINFQGAKLIKNI